GQRWAQGDTAILHRAEDFLRAAVAVLDCVDAGRDGAAHALLGGGMDSDAAPGIVGRCSRGAELGFRHRGTAILTWSPAIVRIELDDVGAGRDLPADSTHDVFARCFFGALRHFDAGLETFRSVRTAGDDRARCDQHARTRDDPLIDGLLQADIGKAGAFGAEVAYGREPGHQSRAG